MCFSPYLGVGGGGTNGYRAHNLLMQFCGLGSSKMEISETVFFDTLTIQNDQISYVKHVLAPPYLFLTLFGCGGGVPRGIGHTTCLCSFAASAAQKWKFPKLFFFDTLTIQNDQISYVKHVLAPPYVFLTLFGCWGGGVPRGLGHNLLMKFSRLSHLSPLRGALPKAIEFSTPDAGAIFSITFNDCGGIFPMLCFGQ